MRLLPKAFKKAAITTVLSVGLISSFVTPAFADLDSTILNNKIGNELQAQFKVSDDNAVEDTVLLTWEGLATGLKSFDLAKDEEKTVTYEVTPGSNNKGIVIVSILLKVPTPSATATALGEVKVGGTAISSSFTDGGFDYYLLNGNQVVDPSVGLVSKTFDISFNQLSPVGTPFEATLLAIKNDLPG